MLHSGLHLHYSCLEKVKNRDERKKRNHIDDKKTKSNFGGRLTVTKSMNGSSYIHCSPSQRQVRHLLL